MTPQEIEVARRAVACKGWRWMPGMMVNSGGTIYRMTEETIALGCGSPEYQREYMRPDLTDPATLGCLLALVREAWGPSCHARRYPNGRWRIGHYEPRDHVARLLCDVADLDDLDEYATEAEALVAALEMANERQAAS